MTRRRRAVLLAALGVLQLAPLLNYCRKAALGSAMMGASSKYIN